MYFMAGVFLVGLIANLLVRSVDSKRSPHGHAPQNVQGAGGVGEPRTIGRVCYQRAVCVVERLDGALGTDAPYLCRTPFGCLPFRLPLKPAHAIQFTRVRRPLLLPFTFCLPLRSFLIWDAEVKNRGGPVKSCNSKTGNGFRRYS